MNALQVRIRENNENIPNGRRTLSTSSKKRKLNDLTFSSIKRRQIVRADGKTESIAVNRLVEVFSDRISASEASKRELESELEKCRKDKAELQKQLLDQDILERKLKAKSKQLEKLLKECDSYFLDLEKQTLDEKGILQEQISALEVQNLKLASKLSTADKNHAVYRMQTGKELNNLSKDLFNAYGVMINLSDMVAGYKGQNFDMEKLWQQAQKENVSYKDYALWLSKKFH